MLHNLFNAKEEKQNIMNGIKIWFKVFILQIICILYKFISDKRKYNIYSMDNDFFLANSDAQMNA